MEQYAVFKDLSARTKNGHLTAAEAATLARRYGALLIGTAQPRDGYTPSVVLSSHFRDEQDKPGWGLLQPTHRKGARPVIRAMEVTETAIWSAYGGDPNQSLQRLCIDRSFLPQPERYDFGTHGWRYDTGRHAYVLRAHQDLLHHTRDISSETIIGGIDLVVPNQTNVVDFTQEPGHKAILSVQEVVGSLAVRMGDVRQLSNVVSFYYDPLDDAR